MSTPTIYQRSTDNILVGAVISGTAPITSYSLVTLADPIQPLKAGDQVSLEFAEPLYFDQAGNRVGGDGLRGHP